MRQSLRLSIDSRLFRRSRPTKIHVRGLLLRTLSSSSGAIFPTLCLHFHNDRTGTSFWKHSSTVLSSGRYFCSLQHAALSSSIASLEITGNLESSSSWVDSGFVVSLLLDLGKKKSSKYSSNWTLNVRNFPKSRSLASRSSLPFQALYLLKTKVLGQKTGISLLHNIECFVFHFPAIWLATLNDPWNLTGCFV